MTTTIWTYPLDFERWRRWTRSEGPAAATVMPTELHRRIV
jgi:hypothetical protein